MGYSNAELNTTVNVMAQCILPIMVVRHIRGSRRLVWQLNRLGSGFSWEKGVGKGRLSNHGRTYSTTFGQELSPIIEESVSRDFDVH
jgi:hypothetical protein